MSGVNASAGTKLLGEAITSLLDVPTRVASAMLAGPLAQRGSSCCEIPPPCWEPRLAGTCCLTLAPGSVGTIRVHVTNCGWTREVVHITAPGRFAEFVSFQPTTVAPGPQERATILVHVKVPENVKPGLSVAGPLLVLGCVDHYIRVNVTVAECAGLCCCDVVVNDCQDQIHHWYDHFYCPRPCRPTSQRGLDKYG